jgi:hypothetical protein
VAAGEHHGQVAGLLGLPPVAERLADKALLGRAWSKSAS